MGPDAATLDAADLQRFHDDGYLVVRGTFARDDASGLRLTQIPYPLGSSRISTVPPAS